MNKCRNIIRIICIFLIMGTIVIGYGLYNSKYGLETTHFTITSDRIEQGFRIVQLTDLHDSVFGKGNSKLVAKVEAEEPDLILITGDLVNCKSGEDTSVATDLITKLSRIAPVYFSYGNQEKDLEEKYRTEITRLFTEAGATVLEKDYLDIVVGQQKIRLGGIYGYCLPDRYAQENRWEDESAYLKEFQSTDLYTVLMCHLPACWLINKSLYDWDIDCVFAGHAHGGQVRIPFIGGLYAPDQGWFPGEECGVYSSEKGIWDDYMKEVSEWVDGEKFDVSYYRDFLLKTSYKPSYLILSRGLGNTDTIPRFNNIPEIVVADFLPEK